jgi:hypothetical protein
MRRIAGMTRMGSVLPEAKQNLFLVVRITDFHGFDR